MKYTIVLAIYALTLIGHQSTAVAEEWTQSQKVSVCTNLSSLASTVMRNRQAGIPMSEMVGTLGKDGGLEGTFGKLTLKMIQLAYEQPKYSSPKYQDQAITEYSNEWMRECLNSKLGE